MTINNNGRQIGHIDNVLAQAQKEIEKW